MSVNVQGPFGMVHRGTTAGAAPNFASQSNPPYRIVYNYGTVIGFGDLVTLVSGSTSGYINRWTAGDGSATYQVAGVFVGCEYYSVARKQTVWSNYWPAETAGGDVKAFVIDDPNAIFMIQANSGPITQAMIGETADVVMGTVNTTTGTSGMSLAATSTSNPQYLPLKVVNVVTSPPGAPGTDVTSAYNNVIVAFNNQIYKSLLTIST